jgi:3-methyladenine DNA glycosylase AlkD
MTDIRGELLSLADPDNAEFEAKLTPCGYGFLGARLPGLRKLAKKIAKNGLDGYLDGWEPEYFEDFMLRGLATAYAKVPLGERLRLYRDFVPLIDNWAVCDSFCSTWKPKGEEKEALWDFIVPYLATGQEFPMRFAAVMMLDHFITADYVGRVMSEIDRARCEDYYYRMAAAWCFSECMARFPEETMGYLKGECGIDDWTYRKAVQKCLESYRVSDADKAELRALRAARKG